MKGESTGYGTGKVDIGKVDQSCKKTAWSCTGYLDTPRDPNNKILTFEDAEIVTE